MADETDKKKALDAALSRCELDYIADPHQRELDYWYQEQLEQHGVDLDHVRQHAAEGKWRERRLSFWRGVQLAWLRQRQQALIHARDAELVDMAELHEQVYGMIRPRKTSGGAMVFPIPPKSYEGMLRSWLTLSEVLDKRRVQLLTQMDPLAGRAEADLAETDARPALPFTADEMRHIAHRLLQTRRDRRRAELLIDVEDDEERDDDETGSQDGDGGVEGEAGSG